jgi:hypothetical protein
MDEWILVSRREYRRRMFSNMDLPRREVTHPMEVVGR